MGEIGIRELKNHASEIIQTVREQRARYLITHRGKPVAILLPLEDKSSTVPEISEDSGDAWETLTQLGEEIGKGWQSPLSNTELLSMMRR